MDERLPYAHLGTRLIVRDTRRESMVEVSIDYGFKRYYVISTRHFHRMNQNRIRIHTMMLTLAQGLFAFVRRT